MVVALGRLSPLLDNQVTTQWTDHYPSCYQNESEGFKSEGFKSEGVKSEGVKSDRIPSTTPGAEPPRDVRDSGSARSHSTHLETSSSDRP